MNKTFVIKYMIDGIDTGYCVNSLGEMFTKNRSSNMWAIYKGVPSKAGFVYRRDRLSTRFQTINKEGSITQQELIDYYKSMLSNATPFEIEYITRVWAPRTTSKVATQVLPKKQDQPLVVDLIKPKMLLLEGKPTNLYVQKDGYLCFWIKKELRIIPPYNGAQQHYYTVSTLSLKEPMLLTTNDPLVKESRMYLTDLKQWYNSDASYGLPQSNNQSVKPTTTCTDSTTHPIIALIDNAAHIFKDVSTLHKYLLTYDVSSLKQPSIALYTRKGYVTIEKPTTVNTISNLQTIPLLNTACSTNKIVVFVENLLCQMVNDKEEGFQLLQNLKITSTTKAKMYMDNLGKVAAIMDIVPPSSVNNVKFNFAGD